MIKLQNLKIVDKREIAAKDEQIKILTKYIVHQKQKERNNKWSMIVVIVIVLVVAGLEMYRIHKENS